MAKIKAKSKAKTKRKVPKKKSDVQVLMNRLAPLLRNTVRQRRIGGGQDWNTGFFGSEGLRSLTEACGYPEKITLMDFDSAYERDGVAARVVEAHPRHTWMQSPIILDEESADESEFEQAVIALDKRFRIWSVCNRLDISAGLGRFAVMLIGADDGGKLEDPLEVAKELIYLQPYKEIRTSIESFEKDTANPRYGLPLMYNIATGQGEVSNTVRVHWSRIIHVADGILESSVIGTPRLKRVWNNLLDIIKVSGGSAEMYWQGAFFGLSFEMDKDAEVTPELKEEMDEEIQKYIHGLTRYLKLQGTSVKSITSQVSSPKDAMDMLFTLVSIASYIPKRILMGSEQGQLASGQDSKNWANVIRSRQENYAEPVIVRPFIDRLITVGILPPPANETYDVEWPDLEAQSEQEKANIAKTETDAMARYADSQLSTSMDFNTYLVQVLGWSSEKADQAVVGMDDELDVEQTQSDDDLSGIADEDTQE